MPRCRKRRIKCDEAKPVCRQCTSSLRKCEGYQPQAWLFEPRGDSNAPDQHNTLVQVISPLGPFGDGIDKRGFQFWHEQAAPIFSSYFGASPLFAFSFLSVSIGPGHRLTAPPGHSFWSRLLPQIGVVQPAVKHLLIATSSLVETAVQKGVSRDQNAVYQTHYTRAIQATCSSRQIESVLMACLLFACCEFMQGNVVPGLHHINSGLNIMEEWYKTGSSMSSGPNAQTARLIIDVIGPLFISYIDKAPTYGRGDITITQSACSGTISPSHELPYFDHFTDLHRAHHALDGIAHHVARMMDFRRTPLAPSPPHKLQKLLDTWWVSFEVLKTNMPWARKERLKLSLQLMHVQYTVLSMMLRYLVSKNEGVYDHFEQEFHWIVDQYDDFSKAWAKDEPLKFSARIEPVDGHMGYISPLFFTATKCRHQYIRTAALNHLAALRVVENNWTSCTAYQIARKIIAIENTRSIINDRVGLRDERDLIRPVEASITDNRLTQATLEYIGHPYDDASLLMQETIDLQGCSASSVQWPLGRIIRIGGFQGGAVRPRPTNCRCRFFQAKEDIVLRTKW
ncbi:hypothetical protein A1O3_09229 [Capronia epimyces CBS 606.96]|uniref:Zn(2)-C6 fungal-type domain-containing protein n=1 Tax=Capronia epimyces CBS 606.96 TaxID=1182542 RepID=W9XCY7_9EURO|nr:uncharacterized protein A1O3_09229 [Capronia epimyces CBS 606.96]EXJ78068.1 hypothetical protein A1O3_09229 [Capronia epimyces CBS 606.96]